MPHLRTDVVPHMGWSLIRPPPGSILFDGVTEEHFYFIRSYATTQDPAELLGPGSTRLPQAVWATRSHDFITAIENSSLSATQFHPKKSGDTEVQLLCS